MPAQAQAEKPKSHNSVFPVSHFLYQQSQYSPKDLPGSDLQNGQSRIKWDITL